MLVVRSGDILVDDEGSSYVYLGKVKNILLAIYPYSLEHGEHLYAFDVKPYLQNVDNLRIEKHIDVDLFLTKCKLLTKQFYLASYTGLGGIKVDDIQRVDLQLYTWSEKNKDKKNYYEPYASNKPRKQQFYYKVNYDYRQSIFDFIMREFGNED